MTPRLCLVAGVGVFEVFGGTGGPVGDGSECSRRGTGGGRLLGGEVNRAACCAMIAAWGCVRAIMCLVQCAGAQLLHARQCCCGNWPVCACERYWCLQRELVCITSCVWDNRLAAAAAAWLVTVCVCVQPMWMSGSHMGLEVRLSYVPRGRFCASCAWVHVRLCSGHSILGNSLNTA